MSRWILVVALSVAGVALSTPDAAAGCKLFKKTACAPACPAPCAMPLPCAAPCALPAPAPVCHTGCSTGGVLPAYPHGCGGGCGTGHMHPGYAGCGTTNMCVYGSYHGGMPTGGGYGCCH